MRGQLLALVRAERPVDRLHGPGEVHRRPPLLPVLGAVQPPEIGGGESHPQHRHGRDDGRGRPPRIRPAPVGEGFDGRGGPGFQPLAVQEQPQVPRQADGRVVTPSGESLKAFPADEGQRLGDVGGLAAWAFAGPFRPLAGEQQEQDHPEAVDVGGGGGPRVRGVHGLGGRVLPCPDEGAIRQRGLVARGGEPEVAQLVEAALRLQDVAGLQIPVDQPLLVGVPDGLRHLPGGLGGPPRVPRRTGRLPDLILEAAAVHVFEDEDVVLIVLDEVAELHDPGVIERHQVFRLPLEARRPAERHLQRDRPVQPLPALRAAPVGDGLHGLVDDPVGAPADLLLDLVGPHQGAPRENDGACPAGVLGCRAADEGLRSAGLRPACPGRQPRGPLEIREVLLQLPPVGRPARAPFQQLVDQARLATAQLVDQPLESGHDHARQAVGRVNRVARGHRDPPSGAASASRNRASPRFSHPPTASSEVPNWPATSLIGRASAWRSQTASW